MSESGEQRALAQYLDATGVLWLHVANEHRASRLGRLKAEGLKAGAPDVLIFSPPQSGAWPLAAIAEVREATGLATGYPRGCAIELKKPGGRKPSSEQMDWGGRLRACGWLWACCYGADEAIKQLRAWGYR